MPDSELIRTAERFKDALEKGDMQALSRIIDAYRDILKRLDAEIEALTLRIADLEAPSRNQVMKLQRYRDLMDDAEQELERFTSFMQVELRTMGRGMIDRGLKESRILTALGLGDQRLISELRGVPAEVVERLTGFLDPSGPLYKRLEKLAPVTMERISRTIIENVALGRNPKVLAREITNSFGVGLTDSLRMARTLQLWSYREASRASYAANSDVIKGWVWFARLDPSVCASCVAMHGTVHELSEPLNDHHNGRCLQIPWTVLSKNNPVQETGQEWFEKQPDGTQKALLGPGKWGAWKEGKFSFSDLSKEKDDDVYGAMRTEASLLDLVGAGG